MNPEIYEVAAVTILEMLGEADQLMTELTNEPRFTSSIYGNLERPTRLLIVKTRRQIEQISDSAAAHLARIAGREDTLDDGFWATMYQKADESETGTLSGRLLELSQRIEAAASTSSRQKEARSKLHRNRYNSPPLSAGMQVVIQVTWVAPDGSHQEGGFIDRLELFNHRYWEGVEHAEDTHDEFLIEWRMDGKARWLKFRQDKNPVEYIHSTSGPYVEPRSRILELKPREALAWFQYQKLTPPHELENVSLIQIERSSNTGATSIESARSNLHKPRGLLVPLLLALLAVCAACLTPLAFHKDPMELLNSAFWSIIVGGVVLALSTAIGIGLRDRFFQKQERSRPLLMSAVFVILLACLGLIFFFRQRDVSPRTAEAATLPSPGFNVPSSAPTLDVPSDLLSMVTFNVVGESYVYVSNPGAFGGRLVRVNEFAAVASQTRDATMILPDQFRAAISIRVDCIKENNPTVFDTRTFPVSERRAVPINVISEKGNFKVEYQGGHIKIARLDALLH